MLAVFSLYAVLFLFGRIASCAIYQACWSNSLDRRFHPLGATATFLVRPLPWLIHVPVMVLIASVRWPDDGVLQTFAAMLNGLLALGAVFRFGAIDLRRFFWLDRLLALLLAAGVYWSPALLYPSILTNCCLQYTVAGWKLGPGYSNLLGFEFVRGSNCVLLACVIGRGLLNLWGFPGPDFTALTIAVVLSFQASIYVNNAFAKAALGEHWFSWVLKNRVQCLFVNAYLRGWGGRWFSKGFVLRFASAIGSFRVPLCAAAFALEFAFIAILADRQLAISLLIAAAIFHLVVFLLTGLLEMEYVVNHLTLCWLFQRSDSAGIFQREYLIASVFCLIASWAYVGFVWSSIVASYRRTSSPGPFGKFGDAADLLMAWWDSPYMRMFSYLVETTSGRPAYWPVTRLAPHDTALTDIHTHIMLLNLHDGLDPQVERDREIVRTGVWGLVRTATERDRLYAMMDAPDADPGQFRSDPPAPAWTWTPNSPGPSAAAGLFDLLQGMNDYQRAGWFRGLMRWPHFPGEDLVPDVCPLLRDKVPLYAFEEPAATVTMLRIKTFYTGADIIVIESSPVGIFRMNEESQEAP